jgi:predicted MFS family arabinose efflux permease
MAVLVNSWPLGIALGLLTQGPLTLAWGWQTTMLVSCGAATAATALMYAVYREAPSRSLPPATGIDALKALSPDEWVGIFLIGVVWSALNVALAMVFGFAPALLTRMGYDLATAGYLVALGTWIGILAIPLGGAIAARTGRATTIMFLCTIAAAVVYAGLAVWPDSAWLYVAFGIAGFAAAGSIMAQPATLLREANRAAGMGVFYTLYYLCMGLLPTAAGLLQDAYGPRAPIAFAAALMVLSLLAQAALTLRRNRDRTLAAA